MAEYDLDVGDKFDDYEQLSKSVKAFCNGYYHPLVIRTRSERQVLYKCCHGIKQPTKCKGKRINLHYYFKNCPAQINFYKGKSEKWTLTKMLLDHNHNIGKEEYMNYGRTTKLSEDDYDTATDLILSSAKDGMIASVLNAKSGKKFIRKDIQNIRNKLFPTSAETDRTGLNEFLADIEKNGGLYNINMNNEEEVESIFLASSGMISNYNKSKSPVIQVDVSFGFNIQNYKLLGFCYYSSITNTSEFAAVAFIARETQSTLIHCMNQFKRMCATNPSVFLIDKDFTEIKAIRDIFSSATILLCKFHVIKYIKRLVSTAFNCKIDMKKKILGDFKKCLYSRSYEEYEEHKKEFLETYKSVEVLVGTNDKYVSLVEQFIKNWDSCKEMWVHFFRKHLPLMGDTTTNRIERSFWTLKLYIQTKYHSLPTVHLCIEEIINCIDARLNNKLAQNKQKFFKIIDSDVEIREILLGCCEVLTELGTKLFHKQLKSLKSFESKMTINDNGIEENIGKKRFYNTSSQTCSCSFWSSYNAPCRHILFIRKHNNLDLFSNTCFHARYIISIDEEGDNVNLAVDDDNIIIDDDSIEHETFFEGSGCTNKVLTDREKFNEIFPMAKDFADILSNYGTEAFNKYKYEFKVIINNARNGVSLIQQDYYIYNDPNTTDREDQNPSNNESDFSKESNVNVHLKFKSKIKSKGRPKRKSKQTTFNKKRVKIQDEKQ